MRILITNDDGFGADGIVMLERVARLISDDVWVVAPASNQSSCSRKITQSTKVACEQRGIQQYAVEGTPADCAIIGLNGLIPGDTPDLVLSGVNRGSNLGEDLALSGTVGACMQAWEQGVPGIALSQVLANFTAKEVNWISATAHLEAALRKLIPMVLENPTVLNVNFPPLDEPSELVGYKVANIGYRLLPLQVQKEESEDGTYLFDYRSLRNKLEVSDNSDIDLAYRGNITITPLTLNMADDSALRAYTKLVNID